MILAGSRGERDPVCQAAGVHHKALACLSGVPMLERVVRAVQEADVAPVVEVCTDDPELLQATPWLSRCFEGGRLRRQPTASSPAASVRQRLEARPEPLFVTTSDHALLTAEMVRHFLACAWATEADLVLGLVRASLFRRHHPRLRRTFVPLRGDAVTGTNLFLFRSPGSLRAADFWTRAESLRKRPWRLAALFGPGTWLRFALRRLSLEQALDRASAAIGVRVAAVVMPFPRCAIDVDTPEDLALAEQLLQNA